MSRKTGKKISRRKSNGFWSRSAARFDEQWLNRWGWRLGKLLVWGFMGAMVVVGFSYLEDYVREISRRRNVALTVELKNRPHWASEELIEQVCLSTGIRGDDFLLDKQLTEKWARNLAENPWVKELKLMRKCYDGRLEIDCELRQPLASLSQGQKIFFLDADGVLLPAQPLHQGAGGHLVQLRGAQFNTPQPGERINSPALLAGLEVLALIRQVDEQLPRQERLWQELAVMDVSNYEGRLKPAEPHLVLYTANQTQIRWGAAPDRSRPYYEAPAEVKLATLYKSYKRHGTLEAYQYVDLRDLRKEKADPLRRQG